MNNVRNGFDQLKLHTALNQIQIQNIWTPINSTKSEISNLEKLKTMKEPFPLNLVEPFLLNLVNTGFSNLTKLLLVIFI